MIDSIILQALCSLPLFLNIAVIADNFHADGILPCLSDILKITNSRSTSTDASSFDTFGCKLSGPGDLLIFSSCNFLLMISFVMSNFNFSLIFAFNLHHPVSMSFCLDQVC